MLILLGLIALCTVIVLTGFFVYGILRHIAKKQAKKNLPDDATKLVDTPIKR